MKNEIKGNLVIIMKKVLPILSLCFMVVVCLLTRVIVLIKLPLILQIFLLFIGYGMLLEFMMNRQEMDAQYRKGYLILYGLLLVCALVLSIIYLRSTIGLYVTNLMMEMLPFFFAWLVGLLFQNRENSFPASISLIITIIVFLTFFIMKLPALQQAIRVDANTLFWPGLIIDMLLLSINMGLSTCIIHINQTNKSLEIISLVLAILLLVLTLPIGSWSIFNALTHFSKIIIPHLYLCSLYLICIHGICLLRK